jgi:hypothetical protein
MRFSMNLLFDPRRGGPGRGNGYFGGEPGDEEICFVSSLFGAPKSGGRIAAAVSSAWITNPTAGFVF